MVRVAAVHPTPLAKQQQTQRRKTVAFAAVTSTLVDEEKSCTQPCEEVVKASGKKREYEQDEEDEEDEEEGDSDYNFDEDFADAAAGSEPDGDSEEEDRDEYLHSLQSELDECADEGSDFYLKQMLAARDRLEGDDAAFVERYIQAQQEWKDRHDYSIDDFDLDVRLEPRKVKSTKRKKVRKKVPKKKKKERATGMRRHYPDDLHAFLRMWNGRVAPCLPHFLRDEPAEHVLSLVGAVLFIAVALSVQCYCALRSPTLASS